MTESFDAVIALGSNIGDKFGNLSHATDLLEGHVEIDVVARSRLYRTAAWGVEDQDWFLNACVGIRTPLQPAALLDVCQTIETDMGRKRLQRWGPRIIDLDILVHGDHVLDQPELTIPHPRITERAFVLAPLNDIAPDLVIKGKSVSDWLDDIDRGGVDVYEIASDQLTK